MLNNFLVNALMLVGMISIGFLIFQFGRHSCRKHPGLARISFGIIAGRFGAILMNQSLETSSGVLVGYRNYIIGITALFGGIVPASIAAVFMFANRVLAVGFNRTTLTLAVTMLTLTLGSTLISRRVQKFVSQWACFCVLNVVASSLAYGFLGQFGSNPLSMFAYFYAGHFLLSFIIFFILKNYALFSRKYDELAEDTIMITHDPLTGLKNRSALRLLKADSAGSGPLGGNQSAITVDIDNFRMVNEALGHQAGDQMIIDLSRKITSCMGDQGDVYHTDGDEFVIIVQSTDPVQVMAFAKQIHRSLASQLMVHKRMFFLTASVGICVGREGMPLDQILRNADTALYLAKTSKNAVKMYTPEMEKARTRDAIFEDDLRSALEKGQLELFYQPIFDVRNGMINQAEALLRWNHPEFGRVPPAEFIPIAERTKLILPITDWVIRQVCAQLADWKTVGIDGIIVSINLTFISFENRGEELTAHIVRSIREAGIDPSRLKLEITESTLIHNFDEIIKVFHEMKRLGVKLALDDFGTGYSSFGYMKSLPLDIVKLDRSLISDLVTSDKEQMIVSTMITIIHGLDLEVVAEGVETNEQFALLKLYGCDFIQGYLFSRPLPVADFVAYYRCLNANQGSGDDVAFDEGSIQFVSL